MFHTVLLIPLPARHYFNLENCSLKMETTTNLKKYSVLSNLDNVWRSQLYLNSSLNLHIKRPFQYRNFENYLKKVLYLRKLVLLVMALKRALICIIAHNIVLKFHLKIERYLRGLSMKTYCGQMYFLKKP